MSVVDDAPKPAAVPVRQKSMFATLRDLWPYMWPSARPDLKRRVVLALGVLVAAKIVTVLVPYTYKWATDALTKPPTTTAGGSLVIGLSVLITVPIMLVVANGVGRVLMNVFNNLRDALFARVGQHAVRNLAYKTFVHMHELSLRYHLQRRTGGLSRIIERGVNGIETIVRFTILNTLPTFFEFAFAAAIITYQFDWIYLAVIAATVVLYVTYTVKASNWRIKIRRTMNESDQDAHSKAITRCSTSRPSSISATKRWKPAASTVRWRDTRRRRSRSGRRWPGSTSARSSFSPPA